MDPAKKRLEYLAKVAPLKLAYAESLKTSYKDGKAVPKVAEMKDEKTLAEQAQDKTLQNNLFLQNMKTVMQAGEAQTLLTQLDDDAKLFVNRNFADIKNELKGRQITATFFTTFLQRYIDRFASTGNTGVLNNPLSSQDLEDQLDNLNTLIGRKINVAGVRTVRDTVNELKPIFDALSRQYGSTATIIIDEIEKAIQRNDVRTAQRILEVVQRLDAQGELNQEQLLESLKEIQESVEGMERVMFRRGDEEPTLTLEQLQRMGRDRVEEIDFRRQTNDTLKNVMEFYQIKNRKNYKSKTQMLKAIDTYLMAVYAGDPESRLMFEGLEEVKAIPPIDIPKGAKLGSRQEYAIIAMMDRDDLNKLVEQDPELTIAMNKLFNNNWEGATKMELAYAIYSYYKYLTPSDVPFYLMLQRERVPGATDENILAVENSDIRYKSIGNDRFAKRVNQFFDNARSAPLERAERDLMGQEDINIIALENARNEASAKIQMAFRRRNVNRNISERERQNEEQQAIAKTDEWRSAWFAYLDGILRGMGQYDTVPGTGQTVTDIYDLILEAYYNFRQALVEKTDADKAMYRARGQTLADTAKRYIEQFKAVVNARNTAEVKSKAGKTVLNFMKGARGTRYRELDKWYAKALSKFEREFKDLNEDERPLGTAFTKSDLRYQQTSAYNAYKRMIDYQAKGEDEKAQIEREFAESELEEYGREMDKVNEAVAKGAEEKKGRGLTRGKGSRVIYGRGIQYDESVNYNPFGKYVLHRPSLNYKIINIKYPSLSPVRNIPKKTVSDTFVKLIKNLIDLGNLDNNLLDKLSKNEKLYFYDICDKARVSDVIGLDTHDNEDDDWNRFQITKGQIIAGNNDPELLKELRGFLIKYSSDRRIPKNEALELLQLLATLT